MIDAAFQIAPEPVARWCSLIGDVNPIHIDQSVARTFGFSATVVPGSLTSALLLAEIDRRGHGTPSVRVRLRRWTHVGEPLQYHWSDARLQLLGADGRERAVATLGG